MLAGSRLERFRLCYISRLACRCDVVPERDISQPILKQIAIFSDFSDQELAFVSPRLITRHYGSGDTVFHEGDACAGLFIVQAGNVRIFKTSAAGREQVLSIDGPGSSIAELPVFDGGSYPASAQALSDTVLLFFPKQDFRTLCLQYNLLTHSIRPSSRHGIAMRKLS